MKKLLVFIFSMLMLSFVNSNAQNELNLSKYRKKLKDSFPKTKIEIDGGVTSANATQLIDAGEDVLVAGSFVFKAKNPTQTIADLKNI